MERRIESDVEGWPTRPFEDGFEGLRQLAAADFSGVVRAAGTWLFFVNGKIVGVFEGSLEDVDGAEGTAHKAPHPSLPLLYAMQMKGGETRAKYYTNETPISEVHETLSSGAFTGYVELSENVLSGDYYQLYHGGRSMSVAFVGNSGKMITGEEAFERADDEVGIYEVVDVDVEVTDVPAADDEESEDAGAQAGTAGAAESDGDEPAASDAGSANAGVADAGSAEVGSTDAGSADDATEDAGDAAAATSSAADDPPAESPAPATTGDDAGDDAPIEAGHVPDATTDDESPEDGDATGSDGVEPSSRDRDGGETTSANAKSTAESPHSASAREQESSAADGAGARTAEATTEPSPDRSTSQSPSGRSDSGSTGRPEGRQRSEAAWREATTVPSLDPDRSDDGPSDSQSRGASGSRGRSRSSEQSRQGSSSGTQSQSADQSRSGRQGSTSDRSGSVDDTFEEEVLEREDRLDRLQQRVENLQDERDEIAEERDDLAERVESLSDENESLRSEVRELEAEIEELEASTGTGDASAAAGGAEAAGGGPMSARAALEGTDLFVRYDSKGEPTLEAAHGGSADAAAVNENLRLDVHTQFEDAGVTVDGEPFEVFLEETMAYRFVEWLVRKLPYEIRETGSESALRDLYDAVPEIDRVEFHGEVARDAIDEEEGAPSETFDVVVRDKMGEALLVANMNDARDPATGRMIVDLQEAASRVKEHSMALSGAFFVTRSFFEPEALETTSEATSGSLLSRDSRASYVKLSRKQGYHLCLVEARGQDLHLNVPEL